jgi:NADPH-dependent 2,4-dienoyl-CoA reductase/sulfur reductase-like enzyme
VRTIAVAGASLAGLSAARALRAEGYDGRIVVVGAEPHLPYDRPPLSKQVLIGAMEPGHTALLGPRDAGLDVDWRLGSAATALDLHERRLTLADGGEVAFDGLVLATGARVRALPGALPLRTLEDCAALAAALDGGGEVVVVGGGFIGAEVAATCRTRGLDVTMVEPLPGLLERVAGPGVAAHLAAMHRAEGVDVRLGVAVAEVLPGRVRLDDDSELPAEVVVAAIGVEPETAWLEGSGLRLDNGVVCDATCLAAPGVVAAGDVARWPNPRTLEFRRVEHWDNAIRQGEHAARRLLGRVEAFAPVPWFWSDQYRHKLQLAGSPAGHDETRTVLEDADKGRLVTLYRRGDRLSAVLAIGRAKQLVRYRALIEAGTTWDEALAVA